MFDKEVCKLGTWYFMYPLAEQMFCMVHIAINLNT